MRRVLLFPTVFLILLGVLCYWLSAGAAAGGSGGERPIVVCSPDEIKTLDPGKMTYMSDIRAAMALWEGLASYEPVTLNPIPAVAEHWDITDNDTTYTFHLRKTARWSNGDPVTTRDFLFAWKRVLTPSTGAQYAELFNCIRGVKEYNDKVAAHETDAAKPLPDFSTVGVAAPDDYTLIVHLNVPTAFFLDLMAFPPFFPLHEGAMRPFLIEPGNLYKGHDGRWTQPPAIVTNGPFELKQWVVKQYMSLAPNAYYWDRAAVKCDQLILKAISKDERAALLAYQTGMVDVLTFVPQQFGDDLLEAQQRGRWMDMHYMPVFGSYFFVINCARPPLDDKRVRKALSLAVNRRDIVDKISRMHQEPMTVVVPRGSIPGYISPPGLTGDLAQAKRLLTEAGYPEGKGMRSLEILYSTDISMHGNVAQAMAQMWQQNLGVSVTLRGLERGGFNTARVSSDFDIARAGWYGDYADPTTWLDLCRSSNGNNDWQFKSAAYDQLMEASDRETRPAQRLAILSQAEEMLMNEEAPIIPLYQYGDGYVFDAKKIAGVDVNLRMITQLKYIHRVN